MVREEIGEDIGTARKVGVGIKLVYFKLGCFFFNSPEVWGGERGPDTHLHPPVNENKDT